VINGKLLLLTFTTRTLPAAASQLPAARYVESTIKATSYRRGDGISETTGPAAGMRGRSPVVSTGTAQRVIDERRYSVDLRQSPRRTSAHPAASHPPARPLTDRSEKGRATVSGYRETSPLYFMTA